MNKQRVKENMKNNGGGLHTTIAVGDMVTVEHGGEVLQITYNGTRGAKEASLTFKAPRSFKIDRKAS